MSDLERTVDAFRDALLRREAEASAAMARLYLSAYGRIAEALAALNEAIAAAGPAAGVAWLQRQARYEALLSDIARELAEFGGAASALITEAQREAIARATGDAEALARAAMGPAPAGVSVAWNVVQVDALAALAGVMQDGSPLRDVFNRYGADAVTRVQEALFAGVARGASPIAIAREVRRALGSTLSQALTLSRTEVLRAYRTATLEQYRANTDIVRAWRWSARLSRRTCAVCWAMHGRKFPLEVRFFGTHPRCRCSAVPVTVTWQELGYDAPELPAPEDGPTAFARLDADSQRAILGPGKLAAYQDGRLRLQDVVGERQDARWGLVRYERSMQELGL